MSMPLRLGKLGSNVALAVFSSLATILLLPHLSARRVSASVNNSDTVRVHGLELLNGNGSVVARLGVSAKNEPELGLYDKNEPELSLYDQNHTRRVALFLEPNGTPDLYFWNSSGKAQMALDLYDSGYGNLSFGDSEGKHSITLEQAKNSEFRIRDQISVGQSLKDRESLTLFPRSGRGMVLKDASGRIVWQPRTNSQSRVP